MKYISKENTDIVPLNSDEQTALEYHEKVIEKGLETFIEVGQSLQYIRDNRLYRIDYKNFDDYMSERWGKSRRWSTNIINSVEVIKVLQENGNHGSHEEQIPSSERVARPLAKLKDDPDLMAQVWNEAVEEAKRQFELGNSKSAQPTHKLVEQKVKELQKQLDAKNEELNQVKQAKELATKMNNRLQSEIFELQDLKQELEQQKLLLQQKEAKLNQTIDSQANAKANIIAQREIEEQKAIIEKQQKKIKQQLAEAKAEAKKAIYLRCSLDSQQKYLSTAEDIAKQIKDISWYFQNILTYLESHTKPHEYPDRKSVV